MPAGPANSAPVASGVSSAIKRSACVTSSNFMHSTAVVAPAQPFPSDPALAGKKPKSRPAGLIAPTATVKQGDSLAPAADSRFASVRPTARPAALVQVAAVAPELTATNLTAANLTAANGSLAANGIQPVASAFALAVSPKPAARPSGLSRAVDAAVTAALQAPQVEATLQTASAAVAPAAPAAPEAQTEPDGASNAPDLPTNASVAKQATVRRGINTNRLALLGVFGSESQRYALVRQPGSGVKKIVVGDTLDGGQVAAITAAGVQYQKAGRMVTLAMPTG